MKYSTGFCGATLLYTFLCQLLNEINGKNSSALDVSRSDNKGGYGGSMRIYLKEIW